MVLVYLFLIELMTGLEAWNNKRAFSPLNRMAQATNGIVFRPFLGGVGARKFGEIPYIFGEA